jgi:hypothetical protein
MKIATSFLAGLLLIGTLGASDTAMAADGIIYKQSNTRQLLSPEVSCDT